MLSVAHEAQSSPSVWFVPALGFAHLTHSHPPNDATYVVALSSRQTG